jgi:hypothetical protein
MVLLANVCWQIFNHGPHHTFILVPPNPCLCLTQVSTPVVTPPVPSPAGQSLNIPPSAARRAVNHKPVPKPPVAWPCSSTQGPCGRYGCYSSAASPAKVMRCPLVRLLSPSRWPPNLNYRYPFPLQLRQGFTVDINAEML